MTDTTEEHRGAPSARRDRGRTVHGEAANAGHRVLAPDDAEVEVYLEQALHAPPPDRAEAQPAEPDTVVILDFGSQFAQLIARRVRELNVYSELLPHDTPWDEIERRHPKAIILSGGPSSVYDTDAPRPDPAVWSGRIPVLGICYGLQLMAHELGGEVVPSAKREYGPASVQITSEDGLFRGIDREQPVWMSHGDTDRAAAGGLRPDRAERLERVRRVGRCGAWAVRHPVPPRGGPYPARQGDPAQLRGRYRRGRADLDADLLRRDDGGRHRAAGRVRDVPSAPCPAASIRRLPRRWCIGPSATS